MRTNYWLVAVAERAVANRSILRAKDSRHIPSASVNIPYGTRYLLLTCADPTDRQFRGIAEACSLLAKIDGAHHLA